jgi:hypothetical protein
MNKKMNNPIPWWLTNIPTSNLKKVTAYMYIHSSKIFIEFYIYFTNFEMGKIHLFENYGNYNGVIFLMHFDHVRRHRIQYASC